ncbi:MAG: TonB-dependent receptor domain-containing protein, partial [Longimicrobiales bacterium]
MRRDDADTRASHHGLEWAAFMMGATTGMSIDTNDSALWTTPFRAIFVQDDWRVTNRLRVNLGLRYEWEGGTRERFNRAVAGGFDFNARLPFSDAVEAAYARIALPELPANQFKVQGGGFYMGQNGPRTWTDGTHNLLPRIGVVYQITPRTVLRTGYGWFFDTLNVNNDTPSRFGFNQGTGTTISTDNGLTFCCGANFSAGRTPLHDPFPVRADGTRFDTPLRNALGPVALSGRSFNRDNLGGITFLPRDYRPAWQQRWRFGVQHQFGRDLVLDVSYNGAYSRIWPSSVSQRIDFLPQQYWATGNVRNQAMDDELNRNIANNPFHFNNFSSLANTNPVLFNYLRTVGLFNSS